MFQAEYVRDLVQKEHPDLHVSLVGYTTTGDRSQHSDGALPSGKGDFLKELENAMLRGEADFAVHSMKDVPAQLPDGFSIQTVGAREDPRDAVVCVGSLHDLDVDAKVGTSSLRRTALARHVLKRSQVLPIRGNVETRLKKLDEGQYDALILAAAGLARLGLRHRVKEYLDLRTFVPAAGQAAVGVEFLAANEAVAGLVDSVSDESVQRCVNAERAVVRGLDCDCHAPVGVHCSQLESNFELTTIVLTPDGSNVLKIQLRGDEPNKLAAETVEQLVKLNAPELMQAQ